jgi:hypothetical protein
MMMRLLILVVHMEHLGPILVDGISLEEVLLVKPRMVFKMKVELVAVVILILMELLILAAVEEVVMDLDHQIPVVRVPMVLY